MTAATPETLNDLVEFDSPFRVNPDGTVTTSLTGIYAPTVEHSETEDVTVEGFGEWVPLTGYTGQYGYNGAGLHPSEYLGGGLARDVLADPGVYVITEIIDPDDPERENDPIGWAILKLTERES